MNESLADAVRVEDRGAACYVTLARPPLNIIDLPMIRALDEAVADVAQRRDLKAVVLRSALDGTFSAGVDVAAHAPPAAPEMLQAFHAVFRRLDALPQATLAAVDGRCLGGGGFRGGACLRSPSAGPASDMHIDKQGAFLAGTAGSRP